MQGLATGSILSRCLYLGYHPASQTALIATPIQPSSLVTSLFHLICTSSLFFLSVPAFLPPKENRRTPCQLMFLQHPTSTNFLEALFPSAAWLSPLSPPPRNQTQSSVRNTRLSVLGSIAVRSTCVHLTDGSRWNSLFSCCTRREFNSRLQINPIRFLSVTHSQSSV